MVQPLIRYPLAKSIDNDLANLTKIIKNCHISALIQCARKDDNRPLLTLDKCFDLYADPIVHCFLTALNGFDHFKIQYPVNLANYTDMLFERYSDLGFVITRHNHGDNTFVTVTIDWSEDIPISPEWESESLPVLATAKEYRQLQKQINDIIDSQCHGVDDEKARKRISDNVREALSKIMIENFRDKLKTAPIVLGIDGMNDLDTLSPILKKMGYAVGIFLMDINEAESSIDFHPEGEPIGNNSTYVAIITWGDTKQPIPLNATH